MEFYGSSEDGSWTPCKYLKVGDKRKTRTESDQGEENGDNGDINYAVFYDL